MKIKNFRLTVQTRSNYPYSDVFIVNCSDNGIEKLVSYLWGNGEHDIIEITHQEVPKKAEVAK